MPIFNGLDAPHSLRTDSFVSPIGLATSSPLLSWKLTAQARSKWTTGWEAEADDSRESLVAGNARLWRSGKQLGARCNQYRYAGPRLSSRDRVYWRVRVWDESENVSDWSQPASFEVGLTQVEDWEARWIQSSVAGGPRSCPPAPLFRKGFQLDRPIRRGRLYISALGLYECEINGHLTHDNILAPGWVDFGVRIPVHTHDVTDLLAEGDNVIGCVLGEGWYCGNIARVHRQKYGDRPALLAQLEVTFEDGGTLTIVSDSSWKTRTGPILSNDLLMGETYDARREVQNWSRPGGVEQGWDCVEERTSPEVPLHPTSGPFVKRHEIIDLGFRPSPLTQAYTHWEGTRQVHDLGQNFTGRIRLSLRGKRGLTVTIRHSEMLQPNGELYTENLRTAQSCDHYTLTGTKRELFEPRFTVHGFRYVEISWEGDQNDLHLDQIEGVVVHSEMPPTGTFECSNPLLNQLQQNIRWGQKSNFLEVPTDCPQRDERLGWTGDAQVFIRTAAFNFEVQPFFHKWLADIRDAQFPTGEIPMFAPRTWDRVEDGGPAWSDATIICPWTIWRCYGDLQILEEHYTSMQRYMEFLEHSHVDDIRAHPDADSWGGFGDWLALDGATQSIGRTLKDLIGTAYFAHDCELMGHIAEAIGKAEDAKGYRRRREQIQTAFNRRFVTQDGYIASHTQTAYVLALHFGLLPPDLRSSAARNLVQLIKDKGMHLATGFVGTPHLCSVLADHGYLDIAYQLLEQETYPSWLFSVKNGATTIWERWDGWTPEKGFQDPSMNSFNHYAYGAVGAWMYACVAGLDFEEDSIGYQKIRFRPRPGGSLTWAQASLETPYGLASIRWERKSEVLNLQLVIPVNVEARLDLPPGFRANQETFTSGSYALDLEPIT